MIAYRHQPLNYIIKYLIVSMIYYIPISIIILIITYNTNTIKLTNDLNVTFSRSSILVQLKNNN
jgi:hypothetical protein